MRPETVSAETAKDRNLVLRLALAALAGVVLLGWRQLSWVDGCSHSRARENIASSLLSQLSQAAKAYELDFSCYPPGDGTGSAKLVECLTARPEKCRYFELPREEYPKGHILNPVDPDKIVHYRYPGIHNPKTFDLWCEDASGRADGINNWERR